MENLAISYRISILHPCYLFLSSQPNLFIFQPSWASQPLKWICLDKFEMYEITVSDSSGLIGTIYILKQKTTCYFTSQYVRKWSRLRYASIIFEIHCSVNPQTRFQLLFCITQRSPRPYLILNHWSDQQCWAMTSWKSIIQVYMIKEKIFDLFYAQLFAFLELMSL